MAQLALIAALPDETYLSTEQFSHSFYCVEERSGFWIMPAHLASKLLKDRPDLVAIEFFCIMGGQIKKCRVEQRHIEAGSMDGGNLATRVHIRQFDLDRLEARGA